MFNIMILNSHKGNQIITIMRHYYIASKMTEIKK